MVAAAAAWWWRRGVGGLVARFFFIFFENSLPSVGLALGKVFAECSIKNTWQRQLCRVFVRRVPFAECNTRQNLCQVFFGLPRVPWTHGKATDSDSASCHSVSAGSYVVKFVFSFCLLFQFLESGGCAVNCSY